MIYMQITGPEIPAEKLDMVCKWHDLSNAIMNINYSASKCGDGRVFHRRSALGLRTNFGHW